MKEITLICTAHNERGRCNVEQLVKILDAIQPEVAFEELRPLDALMLYKDPSRYTLEMQAISVFGKSRLVTKIPVDDYKRPANFKSVLDNLFAYVENTSSKYCQLKDESDFLTYQYGFEYLNSEKFEIHENQIQQILEVAVNDSNRADIKDTYLTWNQIMHMRNDSMIKNIYEKSRQLEYLNACFLIGAGHISGIRERIANQIKTGITSINWKIYGRT